MLGTKSLRRLFSSKDAARSSVPEGAVAFAIGDVHGRLDLLAPMLEHIQAEAALAAGQANTIVICLGDYVDRGPSSREVIEALIGLAASQELQTRFLRGNHDQTMLDFLSEPSAGIDWCEFGGRETLASYGVTPPRARTDPEAWQAVSDAFVEAIPAAHIEFLRRLEPAYELGDYFFAHAGARPGVALGAQSEEDLLWIREPFLSDRRAFEKVVVHGHTPEEAAYADYRRIGIDTGAYATGLLTALRLEGQQRRLVQSKRLPDGVIQMLHHDI